MFIRDAQEKFLLQLKADGRSLHTIRQYERHINLFSTWLANSGHTGDLNAISHTHIAQFLTSDTAQISASGKTKSTTSMNALRTSLRGFFRYLHQAGYISQDPARLVRRAKCASPEPKALSPQEAKRLLDTIAHSDGNVAKRDHLLFMFLLKSGIRLSSALSLRVEDIDVINQEAFLRDTKGNRPKPAILPQDLCDHLAEYLKSHPGGFLFQGRNGSPLSHRHVQRRLTEWLKKAGISTKASPHSLRHSFALSLYRKTGNIHLVKEALHHRNIASTLIYARLERDELRRALA